MLAAESSRSKQLLEAQRDDAISRCARAEQSLALAMQEKSVLAEQLSHTANRASEERFVLEHQRGEAEKRAAEAIRRAKTTTFFKEKDFKGAHSHIDDQFGVDVDDI